MRIITKRHGDLLSYFDITDESQIGIKVSSLNRILMENHEQVVDKGEIK